MEEVLDIYTRVSRKGDREGDAYGSPEIQEADCRADLARRELTAGDVFLDENVSGRKAVKDRAVEKIIQRIESGERQGVIVRDLDRFGRDLVEGAVALKRIEKAGGRLIAVRDGFDSKNLTSETRMTHNIKMAIAQAYAEKREEDLLASKDRAFDRGVYLARVAPFGYDRVDEVEPQYGTRGQLLRDGRLVVNEREAELRRQAMERRADGQSFGKIKRWLNSEGIDISVGGVRSMFSSRSSLGEAKDARGNVVKNHHTPIADPGLWERANAAKSHYNPRDGSIAEKLHLSGLVVCDGCGKRASSAAYGPQGKRTPQYVCTNANCERRVGMKSELLHARVEEILQEALLGRTDGGRERNPYIGAILKGDTRYVEAEQAVTEARRRLEEYRDNLDIQETLGLEAFAEGLRVRKEAYALAQKALRDTPRPTFGDPDDTLTETTGTRAYFQRFIQEIRLRPAAEGEERRVEVRFHGQPAVKPREREAVAA
jgi:DNA invertase Pin-like site-specific DNA recombinase